MSPRPLTARGRARGFTVVELLFSAGLVALLAVTVHGASERFELAERSEQQAMRLLDRGRLIAELLRQDLRAAGAPPRVETDPDGRVREILVPGAPERRFLFNDGQVTRQLRGAELLADAGAELFARESIAGGWHFELRLFAPVGDVPIEVKLPVFVAAGGAP